MQPKIICLTSKYYPIMKTKSNTKGQQFERELTAKESIISMAMIAVVFLLVSIDDRIEWHTTEWVRMGLGIVLGLGTCVYQYKRTHTENKEEA